MMVMIHFSRNSMKNFIPELEQYHFHCTKETLKKEQLDGYLAICDMLKKLPPLYVMQPVGYKLKSQAVAMEVFFELLNHFSSRESQVQATGKTEILERLGEITEYIELPGADFAGKHFLPFLSEQGIFQPLFQTEHGRDIFQVRKPGAADAYLPGHLQHVGRDTGTGGGARVYELQVVQQDVS